MKTKEIINSYLEYLQFERGLSGNTLVAYERDLYKFSEITGKNPLKSGAEEVSELLRHMHKSGQSAKSQDKGSENVIFTIFITVPKPSSNIC